MAVRVPQSSSPLAFEPPSLRLMMPFSGSHANGDRGQLGPMLRKKVIAPSKPSPTLSSGATIETDAAHTMLDVLYRSLFSLPSSFQPGLACATRHTPHAT